MARKDVEKIISDALVQAAKEAEKALKGTTKATKQRTTASKSHKKSSADEKKALLELAHALGITHQNQLDLARLQAGKSKQAQLDLAEQQQIQIQNTRDITAQKERERIQELKSAQARKANAQQIKDTERARKKELDALKKSIQAREKVSNGFFSLTNNGRLLNNTFATIRSKLLLVSFAFTLLAKTVGRAFEASSKQQQVEIKLEQALGRTSKALKIHASEMQKVSRFGDEVVLNTQAQIASFVKDEDQIKILTEATLDLAAAKGMDLATAGDLVAKSIGSSTNALSRYGIAAIGAAKSTDRIESVVRNINVLYGGQAQAQALSYAGVMDKMKNAIGDAAEAIGDVLAPIVVAVAVSIKTLANGIEFLADGMNSLVVTTRNMVFGMRNAIQMSEGYDQKLSQTQKNVEAMTFAELQKSAALLETTKETKKSTDSLKDSEKFQRLNNKTIDIGNTIHETEQVSLGVSSAKRLEHAQAVESDRLAMEEAVFAQSEMTKRESLAQEMLSKTNLGKKEAIKTQIEWVEANQAAFGTLEDGSDAITNQAAVLKMLKEQLDKTKESWKAQGMEVANAMAQISQAGVAMAKGNKDQTIMALQLGKAQGVMNIIVGATQAVKEKGLVGILEGIAVMAQGMAMIAQIDSQIASVRSQSIKKAALGADFETTGPQMLMVGDNPGGRERVQVTPLSSPNVDGPQQSSSVTVNVSGNVLSQDFVEGELAENIKEAVRRGTDFGIANS